MPTARKYSDWVRDFSIGYHFRRSTRGGNGRPLVIESSFQNRTSRSMKGHGQLMTIDALTPVLDGSNTCHTEVFGPHCQIS